MFAVLFTQVATMWLCSKLIAKDWSLNLNEIIIFSCGAVIIAFSYEYVNIFGTMLIYILVIFLLRLKKMRFQDAITASSIALTVSFFCDHLTSVGLNYLGLQQIENNTLYHTFICTLLALTFSSIISLIGGKKKIKDEKSQKFVMYLSVIVLFTYYSSIVLGRYLGNSYEIVQLNFLFFFAYVLMSLIIFSFYMKSQRKAYETQQKEAEYATMQLYTEEIEKQYTEMRKFRHDYQNILASLDGFIEEKDFSGLKNYYRKKIKPATGHIAENNFKLENLGRIKMRSIKSILASKLIHAQELGIDTTFEAKEDIHSIPMNTVALVRIIGILIDNAIEELQYLENEGQLLVGFIRDKSSITFIVENTCRIDLARLHQLKEVGFSTKGANRGLGLSNLSEIIMQAPNLVSETTINNQRFSQKIIINLEE